MSENFAILASGNGSNALSIIENAKEKGLPLKCLIVDNPESHLISLFEGLPCPCYLIDNKNKEKFEKECLEVLKKEEVTWVFLAGFMRVLSKTFLATFYSEKYNLALVVNIHPSLLPSFKGLNAYHKSYAAGVHLYGHTIHFVDEGIDTGPYIAQYPLVRFQDDTFESYHKRGLFAENNHYPVVVEKLISGEFKILNENNRNICFLGHDKV